jgi:hypothetical protein
VVFPIANGEQKKNVRLEMAPVVSISGRILDVDNRPVGHATVMAFAPFYRNGERIVTMLELVHSDDHGEYRLFSLTPGRYYVAARLEDLTRRSVPLGFYPPGRMLASDRVESPVVTRRDYKVFAWEDADKDAIMDLDFVRSYEEKGTRLEIADGEKKSIELNVIPVRMP